MNRSCRFARVLVLLCLACLGAPASAQERSRAGEATLWFRADVVIGPNGAVDDLSWRNYREMPVAALRALERDVAQWQFRPAREGEPGVFETTLTIEVLAREQGEDRFGLEVRNAFTGPSLLDAVDDRGWQRWERIDLGRRPASVEIVYDVDWHAGTASRVELVEFAATSGSGDYRTEHDARARAQVAAWEVRPERVDGSPVEARFRYPYEHCVIPAWCKRHRPRSLTGHPRAPLGDPLPRESVVALRTPVRGRIL